MKKEAKNLKESKRGKWETLKGGKRGEKCGNILSQK